MALFVPLRTLFQSPAHTRRPNPEVERQPAATVVCTHPRGLVNSPPRSGIGLLRFGTETVPLFGRSHPPPTQPIGLFAFSTPFVSSRGEHTGENISGHPREQVRSAVPDCGRVAGTSSVPLLASINRRYLLLPLSTATFLNQAVLTGNLQVGYWPVVIVPVVPLQHLPPPPTARRF